MRTGTLTATGFVGSITGAVNGVTLSAGGPAADFLNATGAYSPPQGEVPAARNLAAGDGLSGGGDLAANRVFNVGANVDGSIVVNAGDIQVGVLASDAQHGARGGGGQHADVVAAGASGFMTGADKTLLIALAAAGPFLLIAGGTMSGDIRMVQNTKLRFTGGGGSFTNFLEGNVANSGRLSLFTNSVERLSISLGGLVTMLGLLAATGLKSGTLAAPPAGLVSGEFWEDTTDSAAHPTVRIAA